MMFGARLWGAHAPDRYLAVPDVAQAYEAGDYSKASENLKKILAQNPNDAQADLWLARCFLEIGEFDQAVIYGEQAVKLDPKSSEFHSWLGRAYGLKAEQSRSFLLARKSREEFLTAIQLDADNLQARRDLMDYYLGAPWILGGSKDKAWEQVQEIAARDRVAGCLARADYWQGVGNLPLAEKAYQQLLALRPERVGPYFEVADFFESSGNARQIESAIKAASQIEPTDPRLSYYRGVAEIMENRELTEAERHLKDYIAQSPKRDDFPSQASAHQWLGQLYERWGKAKEAIEQYRIALHLSPGYEAAQKGLTRLEINWANRDLDF
jgi:tetratricopeptide (TPR) repeat protein